MISLLQTADAVVVAEQTRMGLWQLFMSGGWLMWVLLILGGLTIFIFVERFMAIRKASVSRLRLQHRSTPAGELTTTEPRACIWVRYASVWGKRPIDKHASAT